MDTNLDDMSKVGTGPRRDADHAALQAQDIHFSARLEAVLAHRDQDFLFSYAPGLSRSRKASDGSSSHDGVHPICVEAFVRKFVRALARDANSL